MRIIILSFLLLFASNLVTAQKSTESFEDSFDAKYKKRIKKEKLYGVYIPENLEQVFMELNRLIDKESKIKFKNVSETMAVRHLHFSFGRWMIHNWGFYGGSRLTVYLNGIGVHDPDDMADFLILCYHRNLNRNKLNVKEQVTQIQERRKRIRDKKLQRGKVIEEYRRPAKNKKG